MRVVATVGLVALVTALLVWWTDRSDHSEGDADVVETGTTLRQAGLELFGDPILHSEAVLIRRRGADSPPGLDLLQRRLNGVLVARNYVMMDYDVSEQSVDAACAITRCGWSGCRWPPAAAMSAGMSVAPKGRAVSMVSTNNR